VLPNESADIPAFTGELERETKKIHVKYNS